MGRPAYQVRVELELAELEDKIDKLAPFLNQPTAINVINPRDKVKGAQEFGRLSAQLVLMRAYADILRARISNFEDD